MKPEKENLIHDLLHTESDVYRKKALLAGGQILRRRRQWRVATRVLAAALLMIAAALWLQPGSVRHVPVQTTAVTTKPPELQAHSLTDAELLALFPNTPVGLATLPNGRKLLIFPRPGDEQRFVTRL